MQGDGLLINPNCFSALDLSSTEHELHDDCVDPKERGKNNFVAFLSNHKECNGCEDSA